MECDIRELAGRGVRRGTTSSTTRSTARGARHAAQVPAEVAPTSCAATRLVGHARAVTDTNSRRRGGSVAAARRGRSRGWPRTRGAPGRAPRGDEFGVARSRPSGAPGCRGLASRRAQRRATWARRRPPYSAANLPSDGASTTQDIVSRSCARPRPVRQRGGAGGQLRPGAAGGGSRSTACAEGRAGRRAEPCAGLRPPSAAA